MDEVWQQLALLREVTKTTGALHHAQVIHLQAWAQIALPHAASVDIAWGADGRILEYRAKASKTKSPKDLKKRLKGLDESIRTLLGDDITFAIRFGRETIYRSAPKAKNNGGTKRSREAAPKTKDTP